jgi:hypothetical protein
LHPLVESEKNVVDPRVEEDKSLDIFEMTTNTSDPTTELVNRKLLIFKHYQVDVNNIKCSLQWWEKMRTCFMQLVFVLEKS